MTCSGGYSKFGILGRTKCIPVAAAETDFTCGRQDVLHKHEDGLLWADLYPLTNNVHKLTHGQICRDEVPEQSRAGQQ